MRRWSIVIVVIWRDPEARPWLTPMLSEFSLYAQRSCQRASTVKPRAGRRRPPASRTLTQPALDDADEHGLVRLQGDPRVI